MTQHNPALIIRANVPRTLLAKIIEAHKVKGKVDPGERVWIRIDQVTADGRSASSVLRRFEGLSSREAATRLGLSDDAARKAYSRALARLATRMGDGNAR